MPRHESTWQPSSRRILRPKLGVVPILDISEMALNVLLSPKTKKKHFYPSVDTSPLSLFLSSLEDRLGLAFCKVVFPLCVILESCGLQHWLALARQVSERCYMPRCKCKPRPGTCILISGWRPLRPLLVFKPI